MTKRSEVEKMLIRLPADVAQWLKEKCARNLTSYSAEVTMALRLLIDSEASDRPVVD
jgi:hypothetical protein